MNAAEFVKWLSGATSTHMKWSKAKRDVVKVVDLSVFKDGLGPALDKLKAAGTAHHDADRKATAIKPYTVSTVNGHDVRTSNPARKKPDEQAKAAAIVVRDRYLTVDALLASYQKIAVARKDKPDKLTKPTGPTDLAHQKQAWTQLEQALAELRTELKYRFSAFATYQKQTFDTHGSAT